MIYNQQTDITLLNNDEVQRMKGVAKSRKEQRIIDSRNQILDELNEKSKRLLNAAAEKGASAWLSAVPLQRLGYAINKREFAMVLLCGMDGK